jgi:hypothetical protein
MITYRDVLLAVIRAIRASGDRLCPEEIEKYLPRPFYLAIIGLMPVLRLCWLSLCTLALSVQRSLGQDLLDDNFLVTKPNRFMSQNHLEHLHQW